MIINIDPSHEEELKCLQIELGWKLHPETPRVIVQKIIQMKERWGPHSVQKKFNGQITLMSDYDKQFLYSVYQWIQAWDTNRMSNPPDLSRASQFLYSISHIKFTNLKQLIIAKTDIISIEALTWVHCPNLEDLRIQKNKITNFSSLGKCKWQKLTLMSFYSPPRSIRLSNVTRLKTSFDMKTVSLGCCEGYRCEKTGDIFIDFRWVVKLQIIKLTMPLIPPPAYISSQLPDKMNKIWKKRFRI